MVDPTAFGFRDLNFRWGDHICAVFENHDQQMAVMVPFMTAGLRAGQRCVWVSPPASSDAFRKALARAGEDLPTLEASSQLIILPDVEFYLHDGVFEPDRTMELGMTLLQDGQRSGYSTMRITSDLSWLRGWRVDEERWESYEHLVTQRMEQASVVAVCQYDHRQLSSRLVLAALHTHPIVILGETVCVNPFFSPPASDGLERHDVI